MTKAIVIPIPMLEGEERGGGEEKKKAKGLKILISVLGG